MRVDDHIASDMRGGECECYAKKCEGCEVGEQENEIESTF
jgi:hypothetical protein